MPGLHGRYPTYNKSQEELTTDSRSEEDLGGALQEEK